jgi:hypothetical protein
MTTTMVLVVDESNMIGAFLLASLARGLAQVHALPMEAASTSSSAARSSSTRNPDE